MTHTFFLTKHLASMLNKSISLLITAIAMTIGPCLMKGQAQDLTIPTVTPGITITETV